MIRWPHLGVLKILLLLGLSLLLFSACGSSSGGGGWGNSSSTGTSNSGGWGSGRVGSMGGQIDDGVTTSNGNRNGWGSGRLSGPGGSLGGMYGTPVPGNQTEADYDGDGVPDIPDDCPKVYGTLPNGCPAPTDTPVPTSTLAPPRDSDGDGIPDVDDQCDNQFAQTANGCPEPTATAQVFPPVNPDALVVPAAQPQQSAPVTNAGNSGCICQSRKPGVTRTCGQTPLAGDCAGCGTDGRWYWLGRSDCKRDQAGWP